MQEIILPASALPLKERERPLEGLLSSRVVMVTGAARGIGEAIAKECAFQGAQLVLADIDEEGLDNTTNSINDFGTDVLSITGDLTRYSVQDQLLKSTLHRFGKVDVLVNNAAMVNFGSDIRLDPPEEETRLVWETNYHSPRRLSHAIAKTMQEMETNGSIIFITSVHAELVRMQEHYHGTKAALEGLMRSMAVQYGPFGIRVNAVAPGAIHTDEKPTFEQLQAEPFKNKIALGRKGLPGEVAQGVIYLASDMSSYTTAATLPVHGGLPELNWITQQYLADPPRYQYQ